MPDDTTESGRRSPIGLVSERILRGCGGSSGELQPDGLALRRAHDRGDRGDRLNTLLAPAEAQSSNISASGYSWPLVTYLEKHVEIIAKVLFKNIAY